VAFWLAPRRRVAQRGASKPVAEKTNGRRLRLAHGMYSAATDASGATGQRGAQGGALMLVGPLAPVSESTWYFCEAARQRRSLRTWAAERSCQAGRGQRLGASIAAQDCPM